jgi:hypothetical protein
VAVKTEPKPEPVDTYSLADLDSITDLIPMESNGWCTAAEVQCVVQCSVQWWVQCAVHQLIPRAPRDLR